jgi:hypothetical protein
MSKGVQSWSVHESGSPVAAAEIRQGDDDTIVSFSSTVRAILGVVVPTNAHDMTLFLAGGGTVVIPGAAVAAIFAPGAIVPFACDSFKFASSETGFKCIGLF